MKKNILSKLYKVSIISFSLVFLAVFCYESCASGITEDPNSLSEITLPTSTVSQVNYSNSGEGKENDKAELTIEAYIEGEDKIQRISPSDIMVVFDQSAGSPSNRDATINGIKNIIDKLPNPDDKNDSHRVCLLGYGEMENTGYYTYNQGAKFNQPVPDVNIWKDTEDDSQASAPSILRKYFKKLPSYENCFISKSNALQVLSHPDQMSKWTAEESRADAGLVLASKFIRKRNMALSLQERDSRPLIVIFASSSMPIKMLDGEKISRAESIESAVDQIKTTCKNYGVTPNIYSIGDSGSEGFEKMMLDIAGEESHRFSSENTADLAKNLIALVKNKKSNSDTQEIEITASKFKDPNGEEKTFAELKDQYHFDFDNAVVKRYTAKENKNGEKTWKEDPASIASQKVSATDSVVSCRVSVDETAQLATYDSEAGTTTTPPRKVVVTVTSSDTVKITINTDLPKGSWGYYYVTFVTGGDEVLFYMTLDSPIVSWESSKTFNITELTPPGYKLTGIYVDDIRVENGEVSADKDCTMTFKHEKKDTPSGLTHQVMRNILKFSSSFF